VTISNDVIPNCLSDDDTVSFPACAALYDFLLQSEPDDLDDFCRNVFPYRTFISHCFAHLDDATGDFAFLCLDLAFFCDTVDLGEWFSGDFADLLFAKLQSPDADQANASLHILAVLCCDDPPICSRLIASGLLDLLANCEPSSSFGSLVVALCSYPNPEISAVLALLPRVFQSRDPVCIDYGLSAIEPCVTSNPEAAETLFLMLLSVSPALFEIGDAPVTKDLLLLLGSIPNLPVVFVVTIFRVMANTALPEIASLGCRIFRKQYKNWGHLDLSELCEFLIRSFDSFEAYTDQKSCVLTLALYYSTSHFSEELCRIFARFLDDSSLGGKCLRCLCEVAVAFPAEKALIAILAENHEALLGLSDSEDAAISAMAVHMLDVLATIEN
jgi:hypothetical protein